MEIERIKKRAIIVRNVRTIPFLYEAVLCTHYKRTHVLVIALS